MVEFIESLPEGGTLICSGISGFGKTHWLKRGLASSRHLFVIDTTAAHDARRESRGALSRERWDQCDLWTYAQLRDNPDPLLASPCKVVIDPDTFDENRAGDRVGRIMEWLWAIGDGDVVLEECGDYSRWCISMIHRLATKGGHNGLRLFLLCQNYRRITIEATSNVQRLVLFPQAEEQDMVELARKIGKTRAQRLRSMKQFDPPVLWQQGQLEESS